jgi:hypothetical protein
MEGRFAIDDVLLVDLRQLIGEWTIDVDVAGKANLSTSNILSISEHPARRRQPSAPNKFEALAAAGFRRSDSSADTNESAF